MLYNGSKAQSLAIFRDVFQERGLGHLADSAVILREGGKGPIVDSKSFYDILESMRLVIKPSGFGAGDIAIVRGVADRMQADLILSPGGAASGYEVYGDIISGVSLDALNKELIASRGTELSVVTDDRPFINELVPRSYYLDIKKWFSADESDHVLWTIARGYLIFIFMLTAVAIVMIVGPLLVKDGPEECPAAV